jgi:stage II sporulation protein D
MKRKLFLLTLLSFYFCLLSSQVRVRVLTGDNPEYIFFKALSGKYSIETYGSGQITISQGETVVFTRYNNRIAVKTRSSHGIAADSVYIKPKGENDRFSLVTDGSGSHVKVYSGDLKCIPDMGSLLFINICDIETYVAGVVRAEGGNGKKSEYFKTQAIIARTYTYKYFNKHILDGYNLCDDTHCQVFDGITSDTSITKAVNDTRGLVIATPDSDLIIAAFHSNCGGETSPSDYAWSSKQSYLVKVTDPWCLKSKNATWGKTVVTKSWTDMLKRNGYAGPSDSSAKFDFNQATRVEDYETGSFRLPFSRIRNDLDLRSAWFSVKAAGDSIKLTGRGYGHGVGLCQEGAIVMAGNGYNYNDIITFYYPGVRIINVADAKKNEDDKATGKN